MATSSTLVDPALRTHRNQCVLATAALLVVLVFLPLAASAQQQPTSTTLALSTNQASAGQVVTLTATVQTCISGCFPVTVGTVTFLNGTQVLGTVQVVGNNPAPGFVSGAATLKLGFPPGMYSLTAQYNANNQFQASQSGPQQLTVTGTEPSITDVIAFPDGSNWSFMLNVWGFGLAAQHPPTGTVSLTVASTGFNLGSIGLPGTAQPSFPYQGVVYPAAGAPYDVAAADLNGDGIPDLVVTDQANNTVNVLFGTGDSNSPFQEPAVPYSTGSIPLGVAIWDFNGDGIPDIVVVNNACNVQVGNPCPGTGTVSVLLGDPAHPGRFQPQVVYPLGPIGPPPPPPNPQYGPQFVAVADFNGDGIADLAVTNACGSDPICESLGTVSVLLGNGDGTFQVPAPPSPYAVGTYPIGIAAGVFTGNGLPDLAVANRTDQYVGVLLNNSLDPGTFEAGQAIVVGLPFGIAVADFRNNGIADLAVTDECGSDPTCQSPGTVSVLLGNGDGTFQAPATSTVDFVPQKIVVADFNGDGFPDLAVANACGNTTGSPCQGPGTVSLLLNNGNGTFPTNSAGDDWGVGLSPVSLVAADFNKDGVPDVVSADYGDGNVSVLLGAAGVTGQLLDIFVPGSGQQQITATYTPSGNFYSGSHGSVPVQGSLIPTATTLAVTANGQPIMSGAQEPAGTVIVLNATVMPGTYGTLQASGMVSFFDGRSLLAAVSITINSFDNGVASFSPSLAPGQHSLSAVYSGDNNFGASGSGSFQLTITAGGKLTPTIALTESPQTINLGNNAYFIATLQSLGGVFPTGTVSFVDGTTVLGTTAVGPNGSAIYVNNTLVLGPHMITATYNGDSNYNPVTSAPVVVQVDAPFTLTGSMQSGTTSPGQPAMFTVTVNAMWQSLPGRPKYASMTCLAPAGLTCAFTICPPSPPGAVGGPCILSPPTMSCPNCSTTATVTVNTSGVSRLIPPLQRGEQRVIAALAGFGGFGLVGLVFAPVKLRRKAVGGFLFLMMVALCFGTSCTAFAPGTSSAPVNNTFNIKVTADLREEDPAASTGYDELGLQVFWYELLIK